MTKSGFGGPQAIRMILDKMPRAPLNEECASIEHLRFATVADLAEYQFSQGEIDAITDLIMEYFDVTGFVADTAINFLTVKQKSDQSRMSSQFPCVPE